MDTQQFVWLRQQPSDAQHMQALQAQLVAGFAHLTHNTLKQYSAIRALFLHSKPDSVNLCSS